MTGLTGRYTFTPARTPADDEVFLPPGAATAALLTAPPTPPVRDRSGPSLYTALQEQLGLRLPQKVPIEVLVIDFVNHPTSN
jgi:uncharacterized protein (TIGR03435 family)